MEVTSGSEGLTIIDRISGLVNANIEVPFMPFEKNTNYLILNIPDNILGIWYQTGLKL